MSYKTKLLFVWTSALVLGALASAHAEDKGGATSGGPFLPPEISARKISDRRGAKIGPPRSSSLAESRGGSASDGAAPVQ